MTEQPEILKDYSITEFLDRNTWTVRYQVIKQPIEECPYFDQPIFDTWAAASACVCMLRNYPKFYAMTVDGIWAEVANI